MPKNNNFRLARERKELSQKYVALTLKVSAPTVSEWESGRKTPTVDNLLALCDLYEQTSDFLLGRETEKPPAIERKRSEPQYKITPAEYRIILAYRKALPADIQIIDNIVNRYVTEPKEKNG